jgi:hypothetical protein
LTDFAFRYHIRPIASGEDLMRLAILGLSIALMSAAHAQPDTRPQVVLPLPEDSYNLSVGEATKLNFPVVFDRIELTSDTVVQAKPLSDRVLTLQGLAEGEVIMTVFAGAKELYSATITVGTEKGHVVKFYGYTREKDHIPDFIGFYCTETSCGRADKELKGAREYNDQSESVQTNPDGSKVKIETRGRR